jgi:predicted esterase
MVPLVPQVLPALTNKHIFMSSGLYDPIVSKEDAERLFDLFKKTGANVSLHWQNSGHELVVEDVNKAKEWLLLNFPSLLQL